jgi:predicted RNA-binding Zn-ribbon protein involved in translation (DUF1610 family)
MYGGSYWLTLLGSWVAGTLIQVLFLLTLRGVLRAVAPENRAMRPDLVWLNLVPYVQYVWMFVTLVKIRDSLRAESKTRGRSLGGDAAFRVGLTSAILFVLAFLLSWLVVLLVSDLEEQPAVAFLVTGVGLLSLLFWALYWARSSRLRAVLEKEGLVVSSRLAVPAAAAELRCPTCGLLALPEDDFCRSCGYDLRGQAQEDETTGSDVPAVKDTCPFCGAAYRPDAKFCSTCGRPVV